MLKKLLTLFLAIIMAFGVTACGAPQTPDTGDGGGNGGDETSTVYSAKQIAEWGSGTPFGYSLYDSEIATFDEDDVYDQKESAGFINLYGLPTKVYAKMKKKNNLD